MRLLDRLQMSIGRRSGNVVLRSELAELGGRSQLSEALKTLTNEGQLLRLGSGVYAKGQKDAAGRVHLAGKPEEVAEEVFRKLGRKLRLLRVDKEGARDLYVMDATGQRVSRRIEIANGSVHYQRSNESSSANDLAQLPSDIDALPRNGVKAFVEQLARAWHVSYQRTKLDDWSEAVTRAAGDEVRLDRTEKLLVALKKRNLINARQAARLMTNYMRERKHV